MPVAYYGDRISPHMTRLLNGSLVCHDVPINRIGTQPYMGREIGLTGDSAEKEFVVTRRPEEVFNPAALASFEGIPVTDDHPPCDVNIDNISVYGKGHVQNVRQGQGKDAGYTVADLVVTDPQLIGEIENGKREVSCGYPCDFVPMDNGTFDQRNMRGNHVAIVDEGRAGPHASIKDSAMKPTERGNKMPTEKKAGLMGKILKALALDESTTPEDLEEAAKLSPKETKDEIPVKPTVPSPEGKAPESAETHDADPLAAILAKLEGIEARLAKLETPAKDEDQDDLEKIASEEEGESPLQQAFEEKTGEEAPGDYDPQENEESVTIPPENIPEKKAAPAVDAKTVRKLAADMRGVLAKNIKDPVAFKAAAKDAATAITAAYGPMGGSNDGYAQFQKATQQARQERFAHDSANQYERVAAETQNAYNQINPHTHKEAK